ncbi:MAG: hypothetical protein HOV66_07860 [Streptomycetaceae bacterium]|nr:hypothetical protein [Streptomycetaceae bacterium]
MTLVAFVLTKDVKHLASCEDARRARRVDGGPVMTGYYVPERPSRTERALGIVVNLAIYAYAWARYGRPTLRRAAR